MNLDYPDTEPSATVPTSASEAVNDIVHAYPLAAVLTSAAVGAGLVALITLAARDSRSSVDNVLRTVPRSTRETAGDAMDELRAQIAELGRKLTSSLPTPADARRTSADLGEKASDAWATVREQAHAALDQVAPKITAATELARANPLWVSVVMGAVGALLGSQLLGRGDAAETKPDNVSAMP